MGFQKVVVIFEPSCLLQLGSGARSPSDFQDRDYLRGDLRGDLRGSLRYRQDLGRKVTNIAPARSSKLGASMP